jgi:phosphonate transport system substrate-binding protein
VVGQAAWAGVVLAAAGLVLRAWGMRTLGEAYSRTLRTTTAQRLVTTGPYRWVRHPGYLGSVSVWVGASLAFHSWLSAPVGACETDLNVYPSWLVRPLLFATYLAPSIRPLYEFTAAACGGSRLIEGHDWRDLAAGHIDVAFVCSPPLIWSSGAVEAIAAPVLADPRFEGRPLYSSEVVVRAGSAHTSLDDLRGARWAYNEPSSWSGYWVTLARVGSWAYFGEVVAAGSHQRALRMVAGGEVDGSAIDSQVLAVELRDHPELAERVRVVDMLGPSPIQPVVVRAGLDPCLKQAVRARLLSLRGERLRRYFVRRFVPAPDYSPIAAALGRLPCGVEAWADVD